MVYRVSYRRDGRGTGSSVTGVRFRTRAEGYGVDFVGQAVGDLVSYLSPARPVDVGAVVTDERLGDQSQWQLRVAYKPPSAGQVPVTDRKMRTALADLEDAGRPPHGARYDVEVRADDGEFVLAETGVKRFDVALERVWNQVLEQGRGPGTHAGEVRLAGATVARVYLYRRPQAPVPAVAGRLDADAGPPVR